MIAEELMKKYNYGYVHSCELLGEAFVKDLLKENRELKKQLKKTKRSCDFVDLNEMVENLEKENQELKKKIETYEIEGYEQNEELDKMSFDIRKYKTQQKEFMTFLEDNWKETQDIWYIKILNKFKEIIGE